MLLIIITIILFKIAFTTASIKIFTITIIMFYINITIISLCINITVIPLCIIGWWFIDHIYKASLSEYILTLF